MFYKGVDESSQSQAGVITLGPISISVNELINSIKASLIVIPPILFITLFFSKSRPKKKQNDVYINNIQDMYKNYYSQKGKTKKLSVNPQDTLNLMSARLEELERKRYPLPHWCVYLGWILVFLSVAASAFFTILYSFQWGGVKSRAWLIAFFLSFFESVLIIQPFKVSRITCMKTNGVKVMCSQVQMNEGEA